MAKRPDDKILYSTFWKFLDFCLINDRSFIWPEKEAWTRERVIDIKERMVDSPIWGDNLSFEQKLKEQMKNSSSEHWAVIGDIFYVYFLPSSYIKFEKKQRDIRWAAEQGGLNPPADDSDIWKPLEKGFTRTGQRYHLKYAQFWFILLFASKIKGRDNLQSILKNSEEMQSMLDETLESFPNRTDRAYDIRHAILYLAFPDLYERIISTRDKERIVEKYRNKINGPVPSDVDQALRKIREALSEKYDKPDRPFSFYQELKAAWKPGKPLPPSAVKVSKDIGPVTVPVEDDSPDTFTISDSEVNEHTQIQYMLLKLGNDMGLNVWVAKNDRTKEIDGQKLSEFPRSRTELPIQFDEATNKTIELIDVLWLKGNAIVAAFEIESTTSIYSGLLRMSDLIAMQPNLSIPLYLVAPEERRGKVIFEINRPTFSRLDPPMSQMCSYISFSYLKAFIKKLGSVAKHLRPDFLDEISESCEIDDI